MSRSYNFYCTIIINIILQLLRLMYKKQLSELPIIFLFECMKRVGQILFVNKNYKNKTLHVLTSLKKEDGNPQFTLLYLST